MSEAASVDELHVISDLHIGGSQGYQIFGSTNELEWFIDTIRNSLSDKDVALVINGDFVDFLAEPSPEYFDPHGAIARLNRILTDDTSFKPILLALRRFVRKRRRRLVINLGNHDLEVALPWVREHLVDLIAQGDDAARGRISTITDGTGAAFVLAGKRILCLHGNEVDPWNVVDYDQIRRIARGVRFGEVSETWIPNAGTQLVIEVMNEIKARHPFVDLLKPESKAVTPILLALEPSLASKVASATAFVARRLKDTARMAIGWLGEEKEDERPLVRSNPPLLAALEDDRAALAEELLLRADINFRNQMKPLDLLGSDEQGAYLGLWGAAVVLARGGRRVELLRQALEMLDDDRSFDLHHADGTFKLLDRLVGQGADFIVTGHTHLERALKRRAGPGYYVNTGTWARLIAIDRDRRSDTERFDATIRAFEAGTMEALEAVPGLVRRDNPVASFTCSNGKLEATLKHVQRAGGRGFDMVAVDGAAFEVG